MHGLSPGILVACFVSYEILYLKLHLFIFKHGTVHVPIICISNLAEGEE